MDLKGTKAHVVCLTHLLRFVFAVAEELHQIEPAFKFTCISIVSSAILMTAAVSGSLMKS